MFVQSFHGRARFESPAQAPCSFLGLNVSDGGFGPGKWHIEMGISKK